MSGDAENLRACGTAGTLCHVNFLCAIPPRVGTSRARMPLAHDTATLRLNKYDKFVDMNTYQVSVVVAYVENWLLESYRSLSMFFTTHANKPCIRRLFLVRTHRLGTPLFLAALYFRNSCRNERRRRWRGTPSGKPCLLSACQPHI